MVTTAGPSSSVRLHVARSIGVVLLCAWLVALAIGAALAGDCEFGA